MPGYTHLQRAQPVTFGHQLMAYAWMLLRDLGEIAGRDPPHGRRMPAGQRRAGGHDLPLEDYFYTAEQLGFAAPCGNSIDGVSGPRLLH